MAMRNGWATCVMGLPVCVLAGCLSSNALVDHVGPTNPPQPGTPYAIRPTPVLDRKPADDPNKPSAVTVLQGTTLADADKPAVPVELTPDKAPPVPPPALLPYHDRLPAEPLSTHAAKESPESPLLTAFRLVLGKKPAEAIDALQGYDKETQEILLALLPLAARLGEGGIDKASPQEIAVLVEQLNSLANQLRGRTALVVEKACFARRIEGFGVYDPLAPNPMFVAGYDGQHGDRSQFYAEVRNVLSKYDGKLYETHLTGRVEIYDSDGQCKWGKNLRDEPTLSLSLRQDFFVSFRFVPPPGLRPGNYVLALEIHDDTAPKGDAPPRIGRCKLPFRIGEALPTRAGDQ